MEGKPPGVSNVMKIGENIFSELEGNNWVKSASENVVERLSGGKPI
jgi:hypothetical protein